MELKKWPDECWGWTQERPIKFGDWWYLIRHPIKIIRLAHFGLYGIVRAGYERLAPKEIAREVLEKHQHALDKGEPLGKLPLYNLFHWIGRSKNND